MSACTTGIYAFLKFSQLLQTSQDQEANTKLWNEISRPGPSNTSVRTNMLLIKESDEREAILRETANMRLDRYNSQLGGGYRRSPDSSFKYTTVP